MKAEQINEFYFKDINKPPVKIDRRDFIKRLGGGIIIVFSLSELAFMNGYKASDQELPEFNAYLRVKEDGTVDCYSGKIEMGQGINTSLAQALADELEVDPQKVIMIMGDTDLVPYDAGTWGSMTTRFHDPLIRAAAAEARMVLLELASEKLEVPVSELKASEGKITAKNDKNKSISYEELTKGQKIVRGVSSKPELKKPEDLKYVGKSYNRRDAIDKVTGKALYAADIQPEGLLYAKIVRPPAHHARLISADTSQAKAMDGVKVVEDGDIIAILHRSPEKARQAVAKVKTKWEKAEPLANSETIFTHITSNAEKQKVQHSGGDINTGKKQADHWFEHEYHDGYKAHASIETHAATAIYENGNITMWASSQTPFGTRQEVADALGIPKEHVHMKQILLGGGFGGKIYNRQAVEAARIAKKLEGTPVQLMWDRKEEFMYDMYRSAAVIKISSGVSNDGKITCWDFNAYCAGARGTELFYAVPNHQTVLFDGKNLHAFGTGAWRAPGNPSNTFARESQIDIMAHKLGMDPLEFRLKNMSDRRAHESLTLAAEKFGWKSWTPQKGRGRGIAVGTDAGTMVTIIVDVTVNTDTGHVKVNRAVVGQHMGQVVNPAGADIQAEGCVNMGLGYTLTEDLNFDWGTIHDENFGTYSIPVFSMIPEKIESVYADAMDEPPTGGGEPAIICMGGAVANAVFDACGARVMRLPLTPDRILASLK